MTGSSRVTTPVILATDAAFASTSVVTILLTDQSSIAVVPVGAGAAQLRSSIEGYDRRWRK